MTGVNKVQSNQGYELCENRDLFAVVQAEFVQVRPVVGGPSLDGFASSNLKHALHASRAHYSLANSSACKTYI